MTDVEKLTINKEKIISTIKANGPSLPVQISRVINESPLFTSAFLSELIRENKVKMSYMRVGSSPLYYIDGQEQALENFIKYLNNREKEALLLLKEKKILNDDNQEPVIRVALRSIKDFAIPVKIRINSETKTFWKYFTIPDSELKNIVQSYLNISEPEEKPLVKKEEETKVEAKAESKETAEKKPEEKVAEEPKKQAKKKAEKIQVFKFPSQVKDYLLSKEIEILETTYEKKNELAAKVRLDTLFGKQEFYLIAKDKKKIKEEDIALALQKAQAEKMPALILAPGDIDKKAIEHAKLWRNLFKFEKLKL